MRKRLTFIAVLLFAAAIIQSVFFDRPETENTIAETNEQENIEAQAISTDKPDVYYISTAPIFGNEPERFVAHRGYSSAAPENTVPAFELAATSGFWGVETDIEESADGVFMCMHDDTLERTTGQTGTISDYTYEQLMSFNITDGNNIDQYQDLKIPTMIEYLNICIINNLVPLIEIKSISNYDAFLQLIYDGGLRDRCIVMSGNLDALREIRARDPEIEMMAIGYVSADYSYYIEQIANLGKNCGILYQFPMVNQAVVDELHAKGILCGVWCLDTAEEARQYMDYGVDYVVTNEIPGLNRIINTSE